MAICDEHPVYHSDYQYCRCVCCANRPRRSAVHFLLSTLRWHVAVWSIAELVRLHKGGFGARALRGRLRSLKAILPTEITPSELCHWLVKAKTVTASTILQAEKTRNSGRSMGLVGVASRREQRDKIGSHDLCMFEGLDYDGTLRRHHHAALPACLLVTICLRGHEPADNIGNNTTCWSQQALN